MNSLFKKKKPSQQVSIVAWQFPFPALTLTTVYISHIKDVIFDTE